MPSPRPTPHRRSRALLFAGLLATLGASLPVAAASAPAPATGAFAAGTMTITQRGARIQRTILTLSPGSSARRAVSLPAEVAVSVRARAAAGCAARLGVALDGGARHVVRVATHVFAPLNIPISIAAGNHSVSVSFPGRPRRCAHGLLVSRVAFSAPAAGGGFNPFTGRRLYVEPDSHARSQADAWRTSRPADAAQMLKIANQPQTIWFGDWNTDIAGDVSDTVNSANAAGQLPVLVAYNLPGRDCGGFSGGGAGSPSQYQTWISAMAAGIGSSAAVVILEPDALPEYDCLSSAGRQTYVSLLDYAISVLSSHAGVSVYVDAGNSGWQDAATMAARLGQLTQLSHVRGFSLNVSNFRSTADSLAYGDDISARLGGLHFVLDTSRNGLGPSSDDQWCNPAGRALGPAPTTQTGDPAADAFLWIKAPGESDGSCNGGPAAGVWWPEYALGLAQRAAY
jgi:endoglucanase